MGEIFVFCSRNKSCAFKTQTTPTTDDNSSPHRARGMTLNLRGCMLHCSESDRYQVRGSLMCGVVGGLARDVRAWHISIYWKITSRRKWDPVPSEKISSKNGSSSDVSGENSSYYRASATFKLGGEHSPRGETYGLKDAEKCLPTPSVVIFPACLLGAKLPLSRNLINTFPVLSSSPQPPHTLDNRFQVNILELFQ